MKTARSLFALAAFWAAFALAATAPPSAGVWNIAASGRAASSGDLEFRVTATDGSDPVEITVPVLAGATEEAMARTIRRVMSSQLPRGHYNVELGEGGNVLVSDPRGRPSFTIELLDSDIDNVRIAVQSVTPAAAPTVPAQSAPPQPAIVAPPAEAGQREPTPGGSAPPPGTGTPPQGESIPVPDPVRVPGPTQTVPSPSQSVPPPPSAPAPSPSAPPSSPPTTPPTSTTPGTTPGAAPAGQPPPAEGPRESTGAGALAPPGNSPTPR